MHGDEELEKKDQELTDEDVEDVVGGTYVPGAYAPLLTPEQTPQQGSAQ